METITTTITYSKGDLFARLYPKGATSLAMAAATALEVFSVKNETTGRDERALLWVEGVVIEARTFGDRYPKFDRRSGSERRA